MSTKDAFEDRPFEDGVKETDWTGMVWKDLPLERVQYLITQPDRGTVKKLLLQVPVGQGRKRVNLTMKEAKIIRNSLYRVARKVWGTESDGKFSTNIKIQITLEEGTTDSYQVEFVHLAPKKDEGVEQ